MKCSKIQLSIASIISNVEIINSRGIKILVRGSVPTITMDNCEDVEIELEENDNKTSIDQDNGNIKEIITSKCTGINVIKGDHEWPIPCQFISKFNEKIKLITEPIELDK